jgi:phosphoglycolate phosphatase-like HAD superfamily hydrolase
VIRFLLWDVDGTLFDIHRALVKALRDARAAQAASVQPCLVGAAASENVPPDYVIVGHAALERIVFVNQQKPRS